MIRDRTQLRHPLLDRRVKLDTRTGRIVAVKKSPGPWSRVRVWGTP